MEVLNIYYFSQLESFEYDGFMPLLSRGRRERLEAYARENDKKQCAASFLLLRLALLREYGISDLPSISTGEHGKPYFTAFSSIFFNISHCERGAVCAVGGKELGVDIQDVRAIRENVIERVFCAQEASFVMSADDKDRAFAYVWSRKEAAVKRDGRGISQELKGINTFKSGLIQTIERGGCFISAVPAEKIKIIDISIENLNDLKNLIKN